jgi:tetratricopeptide (TPR) repeat protein
MAASRLKPGLLAALLLTAAVMLVFGRSIGHGFVYDDHQMVERNPVVRTLDPVTHLKGDFWSRREASFAYFRPLVTWSFAWNYMLHGNEPGGYHLVNLLLHSCCALLLFLILRRFDPPVVAWLGSALFVLHPIQSEPVVWIAGRTDLMATMFLLLAILLHSRLPDRVSPRDLPRIALVLSAAAAGLLSKETAVTFPALAFGLDLGLLRARGLGWRESLRGLWVRVSRIGPLYILLIAGYLVLRFIVVGRMIESEHVEGATGFNPLLGAAMGSRLLTAVNVFGRYAGLLFYPAKLSVDYMVGVVPVLQSAASASFLLPLALLLAVAACSFYFASKSPAALFGLITAGGSYLLVSNIFFPSPVVMAERMMNLSMAGIATLVAAALIYVLDTIVPECRRRAALIALFIVLLAPLAARSWVRTGDWKDDFALFSSAVRATPRSAQSWHNLGYQYLERKEYAKALEAFDRALEIHPGFLQAHLNRLSVLRRTGYLAEAEKSARGVVADFPKSGEARLELVRIMTLRAGRLESRGEIESGQDLRTEAVDIALSAASEAAAEASPGARAVLLQAAAENLEELGRDAEAERAFKDAVAAAEEDSGAISEAAEGLRAVVNGAAAAFYRGSGRPWEAAAHFMAAAEAARRAGEREVAAGLYLDAAESASTAGRMAEALQLYDRLLEIDPESERARHGRARARLATGDAAGAEADLQLLLAAEPAGRKAAAIWTDLAVAAGMLGHYGEATARLDRALAADPGYEGAVRLRQALSDGGRPQ